MNDDRAAVMLLVYALEDAWARHDADAYGALFTSDATYTTFLGTRYRGRAEIVESHRALFARALRGTRIANDILDVRFYGPDTAVLTSSGDTYKGGRPERLGKVQTYTIVRRAGRGLADRGVPEHQAAPAARGAVVPARAGGAARFRRAGHRRSPVGPGSAGRRRVAGGHMATPGGVDAAPDVRRQTVTTVGRPCVAVLPDG